VPAYGDLIHTIVTAHGCSGQDPLAAIATLSGFLDATLTSTAMGISSTEHATTIDDSPLWRMQREGCGAALLTLQTSLEHWRRFTTHFDSEGTAAPLRTLTKLGDSESNVSGLLDVGLVIDLPGCHCAAEHVGRALSQPRTAILSGIPRCAAGPSVEVGALRRPSIAARGTLRPS
jgi:hypothetical protein